MIIDIRVLVILGVINFCLNLVIILKIYDLK
jgi:hypothetical protein